MRSLLGALKKKVLLTTKAVDPVTLMTGTLPHDPYAVYRMPYTDTENENPLAALAIEQSVDLPQ
jgi:hypothetical protein